MKSIIKAFSGNRVFANLVMALILVAGMLAANGMVREEMPDMELDFIRVTVAFPGADPEEMEEGISRKIEDAIDGLAGIDEHTSVSSEGISTTIITVTDGYDANVLLDRVRNEVDAITTFPGDAETPSVVRPQIEKAVISLALTGDMPGARLKEWAESVKQEIQAIDGVSRAEVSGTRAYEISIEVSQATLLKYDLTIADIARIIADASQNRSGGTIKTDAEEIRVRTVGRRYTGKEFAGIKVVTGARGETVTLGEIADIRDGFTENTLSMAVNGAPGVLINVLAGEEDTIGIADRVIRFQREKQLTLPEGVEIMILSDNTEGIRASLETLANNALLGLVMVFFLLWLFMDTTISFWVGMGIPTSLLGGLAIVHFAGISLNKITLFGLIMVLGIVADDAIVVGEAIFVRRKNGDSPLMAVVNGVSEVGLPVLASILTTIVAFIPLYHIDGVMGKFIIALPTAVIGCLVISLVECVLVLPAHLSGLKTGEAKPKTRFFAFVDRFHRMTVNSMDWIAQRIYLPLLKRVVGMRYVAVCMALVMLLLCAGLVRGGFIRFNVFPKSASSIVTSVIEFPEGSPHGVTERAVSQVALGAERAARRFSLPTGGELIVNILSTVGQAAGEKAGSVKTGQPHVGGVRVTLMDPDISGVHSEEFIRAWEEEAGDLAGVQTLEFTASNAGPPGAPLEICFRGDSLSGISGAADETMARLRQINGVTQVFSNNAPGKNEFKFYLKPGAEHLGLTVADLASQVYGGFYGVEAIKVQRGDNEVEVNVRLAAAERASLAGIRDFMVRTGAGARVPLSSVADIAYGPGFSSITRKDGRRQVMVSAEVDTAMVVAGDVIDQLNRDFFPELKAKYPATTISFEGDAKRSRESFSSLYLWVPIAVMGMFLIIATMFRSYVQPLVVLFTVPFGLVGAVLGHFAMGEMLSLLSVFGMVALIGVVVNDAIVLMERINMNLAEGMAFYEALFQGGVRRFRAVMLTSISTVGGLLPLITETSQYARQLVPMGISLAFGVAFATVLTLVLIPCFFTIINDLRLAGAKLSGRRDITREGLEPAFTRNQGQESRFAPGVTAPGEGA
ncbi:MAG: efflux RND transporter permease subunit [Desulfobacteraceae bacterium]|nr:efflux RND transporter permease subunit [Desulfobacteraceae bacterium]